MFPSKIKIFQLERKKIMNPTSIKSFTHSCYLNYYKFKHYLGYLDIDEFLEEYRDFIGYNDILKENNQFQYDKRDYEDVIEDLNNQVKRLEEKQDDYSDIKIVLRNIKTEIEYLEKLLKKNH
jgi:hypothetical protein